MLRGGYVTLDMPVDEQARRSRGANRHQILGIRNYGSMADERETHIYKQE